MRKFYSLLAAVVLMAVGSVGAWAYTPTLTEDYEVAGYKAKAYYDISNTNVNDMCPPYAANSFTYRGSGYGIFNYGSGNRAADIALSVSEGDLVIFEYKDSQSRGITINSVSHAEKNDLLSNGGLLAFDVTEDATSVNINIGRGGCIIAIAVYEADATIEKADYTINYVFNDETVKSTSGSAVVGGSVPTELSFLVDGVKYFRALGEDEEVFIQSGENTFDVKVVEADKYAWTAKSNVGNVTASGETWEGESVNVSFPLYQLSEGKLWQKSANSSVFTQSFTVEENNQEFELTYAETDIEAIFLTEAEDVDGMSIVASGNAEARSSQRAAAWAADANVVFTTLPVGKYKLSGSFYSPSSAGGHPQIYAGNRVVVESTTGNANATSFSGEFVLAKESEIAFGKGGGASAAFDYVYIQSLGEPTEEELAEAAAADFAAIPYAVNVAESIENGTVTTAEDAYKATDVVTLTPAPNAGYEYEAGSLKVTYKNEEGEDVAVEVSDENTFVMPAAEVTVSASFTLKKIYIETDYTAQLGIDAASWKGASGLCATNFAPAITTKDGRTAQLAENYQSNVDATGDLITQTVTGLPNGSYRVSIYANAFYTSGRGFESSMEDGAEDVCYVFAGSGENRKEQFITAKIATATTENNLRTLEDVQVTDGTLVVGLGKAQAGTNWHTVQVYEITATVDANEALAAAVTKAQAIDEASVPAALFTEISSVLTANNKAYDTAAEYEAAIAAIDAVVAKATPYAPLAAILAKSETFAANGVSEEALAAYNTAIADVKTAYDAVTVEDINAAVNTVKVALVDLAKAQTKAGSDLTFVVENTAWTGQIGTYQTGVEKYSETAYTGTTEEPTKVLYQNIAGLQPGEYEVKFLATANVAWHNFATGADIAQVFANDSVKGIEVIAQTGCNIADYPHTFNVTVSEDSVLVYGLQNIAEGGNWYVAQATSLTLVKRTLNYKGLKNGSFDEAPTFAADAEGNQAAGADPNSADIAEWTSNGGAAWSASATFAYGTTAQINGANVPAAGPEGSASTAALGVSVGWGGTVLYTQKVELPAGNYKLTYQAYNAGAKEQFESKVGVVAGEESFLSELKSFTLGAWTKDQIVFTLTDDVDGATVQVGGTAISGGSGDNAKLLIDDVELVQISDEELAAIKDSIAAAKFAEEKAAALAKIDGYVAGEQLFAYPEEAIATAKAAVEAAEDADAIDAAIATLNAAQNKPVAGTAYVIANATAEGSLSVAEEKVTVAEGAEVYFTAVEGGYVISNEAGEYVFKTTGDSWTLSTTKDIAEAYVVTVNVVEGGYTIQGAKGLLGLDNTAAGSTVYANKAQSNNGLWKIATAEEVAISSIAADKAVKADGKYLENGSVVIYKNGKKFNVAGAALK